MASGSAAGRSRHRYDTHGKIMARLQSLNLDSVFPLRSEAVLQRASNLTLGCRVQGRVQSAGCRVQGARCRVQDSGCRVQGAGCRVHGAGCKVQDAEIRMQGAGCRVQGAGCRVYTVLAERVVQNPLHCLLHLQKTQHSEFFFAFRANSALIRQSKPESSQAQNVVRTSISSGAECG